MRVRVRWGGALIIKLLCKKRACAIHCALDNVQPRAARTRGGSAGCRPAAAVCRGCEARPSFWLLECAAGGKQQQAGSRGAGRARASTKPPAPTAQPPPHDSPTLFPIRSSFIAPPPPCQAAASATMPRWASLHPQHRSSLACLTPCPQQRTAPAATRTAAGYVSAAACLQAPSLCKDVLASSPRPRVRLPGDRLLALHTAHTG